jgi:NDP-sugar pyrophosphorylase family protein
VQAIILAAGFGKRLRPLTENLPKCLVEVNGIPLLINILNHLSQKKICEVIIVVGHLKNIIISQIGHIYKGMKITYIENPVYDTTNNVYSFYLAQNYVHDDVILLECDLMINENAIDQLISGQADCNILVSPYDAQTMDGSVIRIDSDNSARELIIKRDQFSGFDYTSVFKTVNAYTLKKDFILNKFFPAVNVYVNTQSVNSFYELILGSLIYYGHSNIKVICIEPDEWCEIDNFDDLQRAEEMFA